MNHFYHKLAILVIIIGCFPSNLQAQEIVCEQGVNHADLDINNVRARFWASGSMWFDTEMSEPHYEVPKGSGLHSLFAFDLWIGAVDEMGRRRVAFQRYAGNLEPNTYYPGPLNDNDLGDTFSEICVFYDRVWKINKSTLDSFRVGLLEEIPKDILEWPALKNPQIPYPPQSDLAPFIDIDGDGIYNPLEGDYPEILGDQALWWAFNDKGGFGSPLADRRTQIDAHCMAYAFNSKPQLMNHTFYKYTFTNKSALPLDSVMIGLAMDTEIGQFDDDYTGCDSLRNMGIAYNGDASDGYYGTDIPMVGVKILKGLEGENGEDRGMYTCWYRHGDWSAIGFPEHRTHAFNGLWGLFRDGLPMTYGGIGRDQDNPPTNYMFPSDPTDENGWSECSENNPPADRRLFMSTGPATMELHEKQTLDFAVLWVREGVEHPCPSFAPIQEAADYVQDLFDNGTITNIEENASSNATLSKIHLFPNPLNVSSSLQLEQTTQNLQSGQFKLFDSLGRLVQSATLEGKKVNELEVSELTSGVYFYQLEWERGGVESGKLVVP